MEKIRSQSTLIIWKGKKGIKYLVLNFSLYGEIVKESII